MTRDQDKVMMARAIELARRAWGQTRPNPHVGCVIARGTRILGEGWHERAGGPHAERAALDAASEDPRGATAYVTLEPCAHLGRTPPCADALIAAGIARAVIAQRDPNPLARGGIERLREAGMEVETGVLASEAIQLNPGFNAMHTLGRPLVTLKWALSADGCTSCRSGQSAWISNERSRRDVQDLRAGHDGVLIGIETALRDNARLTLRDRPEPPGPPRRRIVLDTAARLPSEHPFLAAKGGIPTIVGGTNAPPGDVERLANLGAEVWLADTESQDRIDLGSLMIILREKGIQSLLVEGGRRVAGSFLEQDFVDRIVVYVAPVIIGSGPEALSAMVSDSPIASMESAIRLHEASWEEFGTDRRLSGWTRHEPFPGLGPLTREGIPT